MKLHNRGFKIDCKTVLKLIKQLELQCFVRVIKSNHIQVKFVEYVIIF